MHKERVRNGIQMDGIMKKRSLMYKSLAQFTACVGILLLLATPLFYWLTKNFYAEDMIDIIEAVQQGKPVPALDLEEDILHGIMIQFALIVSVLGAALVLTMRFISGRLWQPFEKALKAIEGFRLENGVCPALEESGTKEFARLIRALWNQVLFITTRCPRTAKSVHVGFILSTMHTAFIALNGSYVPQFMRQAEILRPIRDNLQLSYQATYDCNPEAQESSSQNILGFSGVSILKT